MRGVFAVAVGIDVVLAGIAGVGGTVECGIGVVGG